MDKKADRSRAKKGRGDLLLDILNMANNPLFKDAYIIIGVDDETHEVVGGAGRRQQPSQHRAANRLPYGAKVCQRNLPASSS